MSATMGMQGGRIQLEQTHMRLAVNMANIAKGGFLRSAIRETQQMSKKPRAEVRDETKLGDEFSGHNKETAMIERHPAMLGQNHMARSLRYQNGTANYPQTQWRHTGTVAPPPDRHRQPSPVPTPAPPKMSPAPTVNNSGVQGFQSVNLVAGYVYL